MSPKESTATSVVPPPMSTTMEPVGSVIGIPAPMAAAIGSAISPARLAPGGEHRLADGALLHRVAPWGTQTMILGLKKVVRLWHFLYEMLDHFLGDVEVGDDALAHRPDRLDRARGAAEHELGVLPYGEDLLLCRP